jgi:hypothetical protein
MKLKISPAHIKIMELLAKHMNSYESVTWLATPRQELDGSTPYDMMKRVNVARVSSLLHEDIKLLKLKKKKMS